jgi:tellurite methyltransferase
VLRTIERFRQDDAGDSVAELSCLHGQHVRHRPPFVDRPWVLTEDGRRQRIGTALDCPLCDRAEMPVGLRIARTAGPFDETTVPPGLLRDHRVGEHTWARLRVLAGTLRFSMATDPPLARTLHAHDEQAIPPSVPHAVALVGPVRFVVEFLTPSAHR